LGSKYPEIYFTKREAQCMLLLLKGKTMKEAADILSLSARTIEYYIKNMKIKIECRTKSELIGAVIESDFIKFVQMGVAEAETEQNQVA
jgi:DNA-binding CsgD family transcriptional regulator